MAEYTQEENYKYYLENREGLNKQYPGKFLVIKNKQVIGVYDDATTAYTEASKELAPGTFIVQQSSPESTDVQVFHSRVVSY